MNHSAASAVAFLSPYLSWIRQQVEGNNDPAVAALLLQQIHDTICSHITRCLAAPTSTEVFEVDRWKLAILLIVAINLGEELRQKCGNQMTELPDFGDAPALLSIVFDRSIVAGMVGLAVDISVFDEAVAWACELPWGRAHAEPSQVRGSAMAFVRDVTSMLPVGEPEQRLVGAVLHLASRIGAVLEPADLAESPCSTALIHLLNENRTATSVHFVLDLITSGTLDVRTLYRTDVSVLIEVLERLLHNCADDESARRSHIRATITAVWRRLAPSDTASTASVAEWLQGLPLKGKRGSAYAELARSQGIDGEVLWSSLSNDDWRELGVAHPDDIEFLVDVLRQ